MNAPKYTRCDTCGRNAHKVALRVPIMEKIPGDRFHRTRPSGRTQVVGICPSCFRGTTENAYRGLAVLVYDRRSTRERALHPVPSFAPADADSR